MTNTAAIAFAQNVRNEAFRTFVNLNGYSNDPLPGAELALSHYNASVAVLEALCGPEAHCNEIDTELFGLYSDLYKDRCGFRPRGFVTIAQVREYVSTCKASDLEYDAQEAEWDRQWEEERREREAAWEAEWAAEEERKAQHRADFAPEAWQLQAGRLRTISEFEILAY